MAKQISDIKRQEGNNIEWRRTLIAIFTVLSALALIFLKGGKQVSSIIGAETCDSLYFSVVAGYLAFTGILLISSLITIYQDESKKRSIDWVYKKCEKTLSKVSIIVIVVVSFLVGIIASIVGIGGNLLLTPVFMEMGFLP